MASVCATGNTLEVRIIDPVTNRGVTNVVCRLYEENTVYISGGTFVSGTSITTFGASQTSGLIETVHISGTTDSDGVVTLYDVGPVTVAVVVSGTGIMTQVAKGYERIEMPRTFKLYEFSYHAYWGDRKRVV